MNIGRRIAENAKAGKAIRSQAMEWGDLLLLSWLSFNIIVGILSLWPNPVGGGERFQNLFQNFLANCAGVGVGLVLGAAIRALVARGKRE